MGGYGLETVRGLLHSRTKGIDGERRRWQVERGGYPHQKVELVRKEGLDLKREVADSLGLEIES